MKLSKFLALLIFITNFSLLYVYQQTEIFRLGYLGQKRIAAFEDLLDKNSILRYNIKRNGSLINVGSKISKNSDYQMPDSYRLVRLSPDKGGLKFKELSPGRETLLSRLFGVRSQAEAKTVNP